MSSGVPRMQRTNATPMPTRSAIIRPAPAARAAPRRARSPAATSSSPTARLPLTSTASPSCDGAGGGVERGRGVGDLGDRARRPRARRPPCGAVLGADRDEDVDARPRPRAHRALRARTSLSSPSSSISPSTAMRRPGTAHAGQRLDRGRHRRRVGVVGVVEHDHAGTACAPSPCATARARTVASPAATLVEGDTPRAARPRRRALAFTTWCTPRTRERRPGHHPTATRAGSGGRSSASSSTSRARTSASALPAETSTTRADVRGGEPRRLGVAGVEDRQAVGRRAPRAARPSPGPRRRARRAARRGRARCW